MRLSAETKADSAVFHRKNLNYTNSVQSLEELALCFTTQCPTDQTSLEEFRSVFRDRLSLALAKLIIRFEGELTLDVCTDVRDVFAGPLMVDEQSDVGKGRRSRSRKTFIHLAQHVARRAVMNVLGDCFSTLDYLVFVNFLVDVRNDAKLRIMKGEFKKNEFYSQIVELMQSATSRAT